MLVKEKTKYWSLFFLAASLEGGFALFALLQIPSGDVNSFFLGLSASRFFMVTSLLAATGFFGWLAVAAWQKANWLERWLAPGYSSKGLIRISSFLSLGLTLALFLLRYYDPERFLPLFTRAKPLGIYLLVLSLQTVFWLLVLQLGLQVEIARYKKVFRSTGWIFLIFLTVFAFVALTRIGLTPDTAYWAEPGVALQGWQFGLALLIGFITFLVTIQFSTYQKKSDLLLAFLVWGIAVVIWWSVPMDVLRNSFYAPYAYPLDTSLPYSDAGFYDYLSQGLLLGNGFITKIPPRPLYIIFIAGLHALFGLDYTKILFVQTLLIALFPVVLYFLGKIIHSRPAGIIIALFAIFREWTNILISSQTRVSNTRMILTDLPTALVLSLAALVVIYWFQRADRQPLRPLLAGGVFGMLLLLRTQSMLILPVVILVALLVYLPRWKEWLFASSIFLIGVSFSIAPWLIRNASITGKITFDDPSQLSLLSSQYGFSGTLNSDGSNFENESITNSIVDFALQNPAFVARFISTHFLATEINGLLAIPLLEPFYGFQEPVNIYWMDWDGNPSLSNQFLLVFYLAMIALGISAAWHRLRWMGLVPLVFNLSYALSNGVARFSGWRYDLPADWVFYFYFGIGFIECLIILSSFFGIGSEKTASRAQKTTPPLQRSSLPLFLVSAFFILIGLVPAVIEKAIPTHFEPLSEEELITKTAPFSADLETFFAQEDARIKLGRLVTLRFFPRSQGLTSSNPWAAYAPRDFPRVGFLLINEDRTDVVFPINHFADEFSNGEDIIVLGCQKEDHIEARFIYSVDTEEGLYSNKTLTSCDE
ncbi:MAG: hypothetical protein HN855_15360 [Anaerolineae bacterium]|jgi:hypothetical protein|nr:hypothetical protein [Anaerolineae bacterium]MBT7069352.1 hypothetical protein [Anaerolineae bacterium]MBT7326534.1 hypothetical protein [Anaerolineae bacterium]MBT7599741.1 hypothetical protein [Anaerolineae bacterium]